MSGGPRPGPAVPMGTSDVKERPPLPSGSCRRRVPAKQTDDGSSSPSVASSPGKAPHLPKSWLIPGEVASSPEKLARRLPTLPHLRRSCLASVDGGPSSTEVGSSPEKSAHLRGS